MGNISGGYSTKFYRGNSARRSNLLTAPPGGGGGGGGRGGIETTFFSTGIKKGKKRLENLDLILVFYAVNGSGSRGKFSMGACLDK